MDNTGGILFALFGSALAAAATGVEQLLTLSLFNGITGLNTSGSSFTIPAGFKFRITGITFASRGNVTATAQQTVFSIRVNPSGAVLVTSVIALEIRTATLASDEVDRVLLEPSESIEIVGNGNLQLGVTANSAYITNAPTLDVLITGFLYQ